MKRLHFCSNSFCKWRLSVFLFIVFSALLATPMLLASESSILDAATEKFSLTELKITPQIVTDSSPVRLQATLQGATETLPEQIVIVFRDISDSKYFDQKLEITLQWTGLSTQDDSMLAAQYTGERAFPEAVKRTMANTATSWYIPTMKLDDYPKQYPIDNLTGAWFFVPIKAVEPGYEEQATTLNYVPVVDYSLKRNTSIRVLTGVYAEPLGDGSVLFAAYGQGIDAQVLAFSWTNSNDTQTVNLSLVGEQSWQAIYRPVSPLSGRYRLVSVVDLDTGERLRNYSDSYFTITTMRSTAPQVKIEALGLSSLPYRLQARTVLSGDLEGISDVVFYWTFNNLTGTAAGSSMSSGERQGNSWISTFAPTHSSTGSWSITGMRIYYREGWQIMFDDEEQFEAFGATTSIGATKRAVDLPQLAKMVTIEDGELLYFTFPEYTETWLPGEVRLEYEQRSEAWVMEPSKRQIIIYHPFSERGYYLRLWTSGAAEAILLYAAGLNRLS